MEESWEAFIGVLAETRPAPSSGFISHSGALDEQQIKQLHVALSHASGAVFGFRLEGCALGDAGAHSLAFALAGNKHLDSVELPENDIGSAGANALSIMMETNKTIIALSLEGNPCEEECPEILERIDRHVDRNRNLQRGPHRPEGSPLAQQRAQRTRARIMEISVDPEAYAGGGEHDAPHAHEADVDRLSMRSEQLSTRSDPATAPGDVAARLFDLERRQRYSEDLARKLEDDGEALQEWRDSQDKKTQGAVVLFGQQDARLAEHEARLGELEDWRGIQSNITQGIATKVQRQGGDFHGLRAKVMQVHSETERQRRASGAAALPAPPTPGTPQLEGAGDGGGGGDSLAVAITEKQGELDAMRREVLENMTRCNHDLGLAMQEFTAQQQQNTREHADYELRLRALEGVGQIREEGLGPAELAAGLQELRADTQARLQQLEGLSGAIASHAEAASGIEAALRQADRAMSAHDCMAHDLAAVNSQQRGLQRASEEHARRLAGLELSAADAEQEAAAAAALQAQAAAQLDSLAAEVQASRAELAALGAAAQAQERSWAQLASRAGAQAPELGEQDRRRLAALGAAGEEAASLARGTAQELAALEHKVAALEVGGERAAAAAAAASRGLAEADARLGGSLGLAMRHVGVLEEQMQHYAVQERANVSFRDAVSSKLRALEAGVQALVNGRAEAEAGGGLPRRVEMLELQVAALAEGLAAAEQRQVPPSPVSQVVPGGVMAASAQSLPASLALMDIDEDYLAGEPFPQRPQTPEQAGPSAAGELQGMQRTVARLQEEMRAVRKQIKREAGCARPSRPVDSSGVLLPRQQH